VAAIRTPNFASGDGVAGMIVVDSSIRIYHIRSSDRMLSDLLLNSRVLLHPYVLGEIALGNFKGRQEFLASLSNLCVAKVAAPEEILRLIEAKGLFASGIGYVDVHLLATTLLMPGALLWTRNKRLNAAADRLKIALWSN